MSDVKTFCPPPFVGWDSDGERRELAVLGDEGLLGRIAEVQPVQMLQRVLHISFLSARLL